jgi:hypothetical protein
MSTDTGVPGKKQLSEYKLETSSKYTGLAQEKYIA